MGRRPTRQAEGLIQETSTQPMTRPAPNPWQDWHSSINSVFKKESQVGRRPTRQAEGLIEETPLLLDSDMFKHRSYMILTRLYQKRAYSISTFSKIFWKNLKFQNFQNIFEISNFFPWSFSKFFKIFLKFWSKFQNFQTNFENLDPKSKISKFKKILKFPKSKIPKFQNFLQVPCCLILLPTTSPPPHPC